MKYKNHDIVSVTVFDEKGRQTYRAVYVIAPDGGLTRTDSEAKAKRVVDRRRIEKRAANGADEREGTACEETAGLCEA